MRLIYSKSKNKKGGLSDIIFLVAFLSVIIVLFVFGYKLINESNIRVQTMDVVTDEAKTAMGTVETKYRSTMDTAFLFLWLGSFLAAVISAWFIDSHPVFFFLSVFVFVIILVAVVPMSNALESLISDPQLSSEAARFPVMLFFVTHFFKIVVVQGVIILISLYAKTQQG